MDIGTEADIERLVNDFYGRVREDAVLSPVFNTIIGNDWSAHLPIMYSFWQTILLQKGNYSGNPVQKHIAIDKRTPLQPEHYERWLQLWTATVNELFAGPVANEAIKRATLMLQLISTKVQWARDGKLIQ